ncbi:MAG: hypothetical protein FOGNACKC_02918 [Anaerolineae bacterium]|nr:hypothetical protein [Anaerolineae bacterium]
MPERLYQLRFDLAGSRLDVTPPDFVALPAPATRNVPERITFDPHTRSGRFVREVPDRYQITSPANAAEYLQTQVFHPFAACQQEELWALYLNTKNYITHDSLIYRGNVNSSVIRVAEIFQPAIRHNTPSLILSHNHPSGDPAPSPEDIQVTERVVAAGRILDIAVLDHLIIGNAGWVSLKEKGLGF